jgi:hypothetical protein
MPYWGFISQVNPLLLLASNQPNCIPLQHLKNGSYVYRLEDLKGRIVAANRLVVLNNKR